MADYTCHKIRRAGDWSDGFEACVLTYDDRFLRRKVIKTAQGEALFVDFEHTTSLNHGDAFELTDGRFIECVSAQEPLYRVTGDLVRLAWHIGNRHSPCEITAEYLLVPRNHVMKDMLAKLGADVEDVLWPFNPEGGAYGHGRTHGHDPESGHAH